MSPGLDRATVENWMQRVAAERKRTAPPPGFPTLSDLPAGRYTDPAFFALERQRLWGQTWLYAGHVDELPVSGSYFLWRHGRAPIVVIRGDDDEIRAFYNTCRHRGAPVLRDPRGTAGARLVCGYHGWSYDRAGALRSVTEPRDWHGFDASCRGLTPVRCERFANWLFINEDPEAEPLERFLQPVVRFWTHLSLASLRLVERYSREISCHYKVLIDNFLEAYHFNLLHPRTTHRIFDNQGTSIHLWRHGHSVMLSPHRRADWVDPGAVGAVELHGATAIEREHNPSYCVFPNLIVPIAATAVPCVAIWPVGPKRSVLDVMWFAPDGDGGAHAELWPTRIANFQRILDEDIQLAEPMQATIESPGFTGVPLSYQERRIYHWHEELDRRLGRDHIPPHLRVTPRLSAYVE